MTNNPISDFEQRLRKATKWRHHNEAVKEIVGHYQDLYQEALLKGASVEEARMHAESKIGNVSEIAKGIRSGNSISIGMKLQWIASALFVFGALLARVMGMNGYLIGSVWGRVIEACDPIGFVAIFIAGFLAALGILKSKRVAILSFCLAVGVIALCQTVILLRFSRSFSVFDARMKAHTDHWHDYAVKYRPIMNERYDLYIKSITGTQKESEEAIRKLSASIKRPQDRGAGLLDGEKGQWIFPLTAQAVRARNIRVFPLRVDNLNFIHFGATDSFEIAQKEWRSSDELLKAMPILRKGSEAEFANTSKMGTITARETIAQYTIASLIPFLASTLLSFLMIGIANAMSKLFPGRKNAL